MACLGVKKGGGISEAVCVKGFCHCSQFHSNLLIIFIIEFYIMKSQDLFSTLLSLFSSYFRNDIIQKKVNIIIVILSFCDVCAIILSFVHDVHDNFVEMSKEEVVDPGQV